MIRIRFVVLVLMLAAPRLASADPITQAPVQLAPYDGLITVGISRPPYFDPAFGLVLSWQDVANEDGYELEIEYTPLSGGPQTYRLQVGRDAESYRLVTFPPGAGSGTILPGRYRWRVRGYQGSFDAPASTGPFSPFRLFQVYVDLPYSLAPDIVVQPGPMRIDYRDVFAFALAWMSVYPDPPYSLAADCSKNGIIDETDLAQLVAWRKKGEFDALLPAPEVANASEETADYSRVVSGETQLLLTWARTDAFGYYVRIAYSDRDFLVFLPNPGAGVNVVLVVNPFVTQADVYNLQIAAIDHRNVPGRWSPFFRFIVEDR
ncbi:hypothetical protein HS125_02775 [bacterium]|nr:hypothetical protein [bacterium]